jgi:hypothetical protein
VQRPCEVCSGTQGQGKIPSDRYLLIEGRVVALCPNHLKAVKRAKIKTLAALHKTFHEATGARSMVSRRAASNRRVFPARPEGRRKSEGRRWQDQLDD